MDGLTIPDMAVQLRRRIAKELAMDEKTGTGLASLAGRAIKFTDDHKPAGSDWMLCESATFTPVAKTIAKPVAAAKE